MTGLLPVVAEEVGPLQLGHGDFGLARAVRAHQGDVLALAQGAGGEEDVAPGRHGDDDVGRERFGR